MIIKKIIAVHSENNAKQKKQSYWLLKQVVNIVTVGL
jgi:hypothetical protein